MKRPVIDEWGRRVLREMPDCLYAQALRIKLAKLQLKKELGAEVLKKLDKLKLKDNDKTKETKQ